MWLFFSNFEGQNRQRRLREMVFVAVPFGHQEANRTEKTTREEVCGCPLRTSRDKPDREKYEKRSLWLSLADIKRQTGQRKSREKKFVAVPCGHQEANRTEKITRKEVCSCPFRTSRGKTDREDYEKWYLWLSLADIKRQTGQRKLREKKFVAVPFGHQETTRTEKITRKEACGCLFRT